MVVAWKDGGRRDLDRFFGDAVRRAAAHIAPFIEEGVAARLGAAPRATGVEVVVVPVPARAASTRARGIDLPALLARAAAQGLAEAGLRTSVRPVLTIGRGEQRGASARQRLTQASSLRVHRDVGEPAVALLVDDVMTTGATLAAAMRALDVTFLTVGAGLCVAAAPPSGARDVLALS